MISCPAQQANKHCFNVVMAFREDHFFHGKTRGKLKCRLYPGKYREGELSLLAKTSWSTEEFIYATQLEQTVRE